MSKKITIILISVMMVLSQIAPAFAENDALAVNEDTVGTVEDNNDTITDEDTDSDIPEEETAPEESEEKEALDEAPDYPPVYEDGVIFVHSYDQLLLVGTEEPVHTGDLVSVGEGEIAEDENGNVLTYGKASAYRITEDISLEDMWLPPEDFTGTISPGKTDDDRSVYEGGSIFIYNLRQLGAIGDDKYPVMSGDASAETFGMGQVIYDGEDILTYAKDRNYILSSQFSTDLPRLKAAPRRGAGSLAGRDFNGQVIKTIDGTKYILIGNEDQLRKIGSGDEVMTAVYQTDYKAFTGHVLDVDENGNPIMLYGGDADLLQSQNGKKDFGFQQVDSKTGSARYYTGVDQTTGQPYLDATHTSLSLSNAAGGWHTGEKYTSDANYIVFRDIELEQGNWTPIMFNGVMIGARSNNGEKLWDGQTITDATEVTLTDDAHRPVISEITINQNQPINLSKYEGVGFFATITNKEDVANIGVSGGTAKVINIELQDVDVTNSATTSTIDQTLINAVTSGLGSILGFLVDGLTTVLSFGSMNLDLQTTLNNLLNARSKDPSIFATGSFAGRIDGDVLVDNCKVTNTEVTSVNDRTGGFVGYATGMTEYSGLTQVLGGTVDVLASLLNIIPGVGLGDLVTILLENALPVNSLIPTRYINPVIKDCEVENLTGTIGTATTDYNGGFIGQKTGTHIIDSKVENSDYEVKAENYGGGFVGIARDAEIKGTLDGVGVDLSSLISRIHPQSMLQKCEIENSDVSVSGTNALGGFAGALANSYTIDCGIDAGDLDVAASGDYAGGFAGYATVGWQSNLGQDENTENSLLGTVRQLATGLLSTNASQGQALLSIMGASPSAVIGTQVSGDAINVSATGDYAGGLIGKGDGVYLGSSSASMMSKLEAWNAPEIDGLLDRDTTLTGLESVSADNYAGGVCGFLGSAAFQGLLNDVVGLGDFIGFIVENVTVTGISSGYTVTAETNDAGGGFGSAVGGTIDNTKLNNLLRVQAKNRAGGFVGVAGPGELAGTGGLTVNLLGLNNVLSVSNLLSIGQGVEVEITDSDVTGVSSGFTVEALGNEQDVYEYTAAGFIAEANSTKIENSHVYNLSSVTAPEVNGYAGGYAGTSETGGLADVADENSVSELISINGLVDAIGYLLPEYTDCTVHFVGDRYVDADVAGGFIADMESGTVDNEYHEENGQPDHFAVYNIDDVKGRTYGGGFGGRVVSGALADAGKGLSVLGKTTLDVSGLLGVMDAYIPVVRYAGVNTPGGFTVEASTVRTGPGESLTGSAGGFIGYASGAQVSHSDVYRLKHTIVTPPDDLEAINAPTYFNDQSSYAVTGGRYAGGYIGNMDIGSAASVGNGLGALGNTLNVSNVVSALSVVVSTVEHSDVEGCPGGFAVIATGEGSSSEGMVGRSGGFAGNIEGGHIQDSHSKNFSYIIGEVAAGGYVGELKPGSVAKLLGNAEVDANGNYTDNTNILSKLLGVADISNNLLSLVQSFVPTIRNSTTTCIPCGGAVRANSPSDSGVQRGMAGGYAGHNEGGQIWGNNSSTWEAENDGNGRIFSTERTGNYTGPKSLCKAVRIRSVYGYEYAGGFTGYMECASTAETGNIGLLGGLIKLDSAISALKATYPTEENTAVYGPLLELDVATWNAWVKYVGKYGGYGKSLAETGTVSSQAELDEKLEQYAYGYHVRAGRLNHVNDLITEGGDAGGYVGLMRSGVITNGQGYGAKHVEAMRSAGGFAGRMKTGGAAEFGNASILGLNLGLGRLLQAAEVFVPTIKSSSVDGYPYGLSVYSYGNSMNTDVMYACGYAGGYAGSVYGGQIWGDEAVGDPPATGCNVHRLKSVTGRNAVGGYVGLATAASVANADTHASDGLLQGILDTLISTPTGLLNVMQATITTIRGVEMTTADENWGLVVGEQNFPPIYAGGFAGMLEATVIGDKDGESNISIGSIRSVDGRLYAGGFFGLADVTSVASVSPDGNTSILGLIQAGQVSLLDIFRTYIYHSSVQGVPEGLTVTAHESQTEGYLNETRQKGSAGGFGGGLMNGHTENCSVENLNTVKGLNYVGGFIGHMGKNGAVDVDSAQVGSGITNLLGASAGVLDIFGAHAELCTVEGIDDGFVVIAEDGTDPIAGGFAGYADLSRIKQSEVSKLKQVYSEGDAGGFTGKTSMKYLADVELDSALVNALLNIINALVKALYIPNLENLMNSDLLSVPPLAEIGLLKDGDLLSVNLLGLRISVALAKDNGQGGTDTAIITIGDSTIRLPASEDGVNTANIDVKLFKANATKIEDSTVEGIGIGYDVYGGGATHASDGVSGAAGGFVGFNNEGRLFNNEMILCDEIRGSAGNTGPFTGTSRINSVYPRYQDLETTEGEDDNGMRNRYHVYRVGTGANLLTADNQQIGDTAVSQTVNSGENVTYQRYDVRHLEDPIHTYSDWENAVTTPNVPAEVYVSSAKAVLMKNQPTERNQEGIVPRLPEGQDPCDEDIDLTINKTWDDRHNIDGSRPDTITVRILSSSYDIVFDANGDEISRTQATEPAPVINPGDVTSDMDGWFDITKAADGQPFSATWTKTVHGLPAAERQDEVTVTYYTYTVEEKEVPGYSTTYSYDSEGYTATITNTHMPIFPITGGIGGILIIAIGIILVVFGLWFGKHRKTEKPLSQFLKHGKEED